MTVRPTAADRSTARRVAAGALGTVLALLASAGAALPAQAAVPSVTVGFDFMGGTQPFTVPAGVTSITVTAAGGHGGPSPYDVGSSGGRGATVTGAVPVTPGATLDVVVAGDAGSAGNSCDGTDAVSCGGFGAGNGGSHFYAGGGGGGSAVRGPGGSDLVTAGGGGGAGAGDFCASVREAGGDGGDAGTAGASGTDCTGPGFVLAGGGGGGAGTADAPGAAGAGGRAQAGGRCTVVDDGLPGQPGSGRDGGGSAAGDGADAAGAGGGGWRGGGTGGSQASSPVCAGTQGGSGGGGGGSSFVAASATGTTTGLSDRAMGANGRVTITYVPATTRISIDPTSSSVAAGGTQAYRVTGYAPSGSGDVTDDTGFAISPSSGGSATGASCTANACTAQTAGTYTVTATRGSLTATAALTVTAGVPATVVATSSSGQSATAGTAFAGPLVAGVTDAYGNPVAGAPVRFAVDPSSTGSATLSGGASATTGADGQASTTLTAGSTAGPVTVTATSGGASAAFLETVTAAGPARADLVVTLGGPTSIKNGGTGTLTVTVRNAGPSASGRYAAAIGLPRQLTPAALGGGTRYGSVVLFRGTGLASGASASYAVTASARGKGTVAYAGAAVGTTTDPKTGSNVAVRTLSIG